MKILLVGGYPLLAIILGSVLLLFLIIKTPAPPNPFSYRRKRRKELEKLSRGTEVFCTVEKELRKVLILQNNQEERTLRIRTRNFRVFTVDYNQVHLDIYMQ